ncbi:MAG: hypothetical protein OQL28_06690 [Sedimenticola sp.]|nr:hypothetical protein [Sedimenticola sp.]
MKQHFGVWIPGLILLLSFSATVHSEERTPFTESVVIFNTVCAKCHEAECSGRLSFDDAYETSRSHIIRHYGEASDKKWLQQELFVILNYMKERCAYYPMDAPLPARRVWSGEILQRMSTLLERNYFIPLGPFVPGQYRINLEMERDARVTVHLVSERFDMVVEDCMESSDKAIHIPVTIMEPGGYYFRMYPREPVRIERLSVVEGGMTGD